MYMAIRRLKIRPGLLDETVRLVENELLPILSSMPGFVEYEVVQIGEDEGLTISIFETQEQAETSSLAVLRASDSERALGVGNVPRKVGASLSLPLFSCLSMKKGGMPAMQSAYH